MYHQTAQAWNALIPAGAVRVIAEDGWLAVSGDVEWEHQSNATEIALRNLIGVRGLLNLIQIKPGVAPHDATRYIEAAQRRCAHNHPQAISVAVNGGTVRRLGSWIPGASATRSGVPRGPRRASAAWLTRRRSQDERGARPSMGRDPGKGRGPRTRLTCSSTS